MINCHANTLHLFTAKGGQGCTVTAALATIELAATRRVHHVYDGAATAVTDLIDWGLTPVPDDLRGRRCLVTTACHLAIAAAVGARIDGIILVAEADRRLGRHDVERALRASVVATIERDPAIARAVDAGVLTSRYRGPHNPLAGMLRPGHLIAGSDAGRVTRSGHRWFGSDRTTAESYGTGDPNHQLNGQIGSDLLERKR